MNWRLLKLSFLTRRLSVRSLVLGLLVAVGVSALATTPASAQVGSWVTDKIGVSLAQIFGWVLLLLIYVVGYLTIVLTKIFSWAVTYSDFIYNGTVAIGWEIVRDFCNMFFVVAILAIAWATILQLESYGYRRLLLKLMLMAVLINFSKLICGAIIDLGQIMILTFAQATVGGIEVSNLFIKLGVGDLTSFTGVIDNSTTAGQAFSLVGTLLFGFVLLVIIFGLILAYTVIFSFRIVALWILIILSPLAFLLAAFPVGSGYSRQWWQSFTKYVFSGVVIMFFFWLALVTSEQAFTILSPELASEQQNSLLGVTSSRMGSPINLSRFIITASFLIAGLMAAQRAGVAGSDFAGNVLQRLRRAPGQLGRMAYRSSRDTYTWGARKIAAGKFSIGVPFTKWQWKPKAGGPDLNVMNWVRGFKESRFEKRIQEESTGRQYAGEALHRGGWRGTFRGLGAGRDFFDAYARGFLNVEGFKRMVGAVRGGEAETKKIMEQVKIETGRQKDLESESALLLKRAGKDDFIEEGADAWVTDEAKLSAQVVQVQAARASTTPGTVSKLEKQYRKEYLRSAGVDDDKERDRLADLNPGEAEYTLWFDDRWDKFIGDRDREVATKQLRAEAQAISRGPKTDAKWQEMNALGRRAAGEDVRKKEEEFNRISAGHLTAVEVATRQTAADKIVEELKRVDRDLTSAVLSGKDTTNLDAEKSRLLGDLKKIAVETTTGKWDAKSEVADFAERVKRLKQFKSYDKVNETFTDSIFAKAERALENAKLIAQAPDTSDDQKQVWRDRVRAIQEEIKESKKREGAAKERAAKAEAPKAFYADEGYQGLIREQMSKIHGQNSDELNAAFRSALRDKDKIKAAAIAMKMARDGNDNELWNEFGFNSTAEGKHAFFDAVMMGHKGVKDGDGKDYTGPSFDMSHEEALGVENAIDYINEDVNHWETARTIKMENGMFRRMSEEEHTLSALAEIMKKNPREVARSFNRLAYGGEHVDNRVTGERSFRPTKLGEAILMALGPEILKNVDRGEYNKNAVINIAGWSLERGGAEELRRRKVDDRFLRRIESIYNMEKTRGTTGASATIRQLFHGSY